MTDGGLQRSKSQAEDKESCVPRQYRWTDFNLPMVLGALRQTARQVKRSPFTYCVGMSSVLLVVTVGAVVQTLLQQAPLILFREAESSTGQLDFVVQAAGYSGFQYVDYTRLASLAAQSAEPELYSYHTPRYELETVVHPASSCQIGNHSDPEAPEEFASSTMSIDVDNKWMYETGYGNAQRPEKVGQYCLASCLSSRCNSQARQGATLFLIDSEKETRMGLGRTWGPGVIPAGQAVLKSQLAKALAVEVGDTIFVRVNAASLIRYAFTPANGPPVTQAKSGPLGGPSGGDLADTTWGWADKATFHPEIALPVTVHAIVESSAGKFQDRMRNAIVMEYGTFVKFAATRLHPTMRAPAPGSSESAAMRANPDGDLYKVAQTVVFNVAPDQRLDIYTDADYDSLQANMVKFSSQLLYVLGFSMLQSDLPILDELRDSRFATLFLGLVMDILLFILFSLSSVLIYSLLMINVQNRAFELAIRRMIGSTRPTLILLLVTQAMSFAIPALILGLILASIFAAIAMAQFSDLSSLPVSGGLTGRAVFIAIILAVAIPLVASIGPIRSSLAKSLRDALDVHRAKVSALSYSIERAEDSRVSWSVVAIGTTLSVFGFAVYYLIPLSLLSLNLSLFFNVFFWILIGMLFGLVLLSLNLETVLEKGIVMLSLFWEKAVLRQLTLANLVAHRIRNRKTLVMYALSLAFIVFISTAANLEIQSAEYRTRQRAGAPIYVERRRSDDGEPPFWSTVVGVENVAAGLFGDKVQRTAWITQQMEDIVRADNVGSEELSNVGRVYQRAIKLHGASPNLASAVFQDFYVESSVEHNTSLTVTEQMYTTAGSQGIIVPAFIESELGIDRGGFGLLVNDVTTRAESTTADGDGAGDEGFVFGGSSDTVTTQRRRMRLLALLTSMGAMRFSEQASNFNNEALASIPHMLELASIGGRKMQLRDLPMERFLIQPVEDVDDATLDQLVDALQGALAGDPYWEVEDIRQRLTSLGITQLVLSFFFTLLSAVAMFLCFFSLLASMVTNIHEQKKEVGILLAIGLKPDHMVRVFAYEAYALVMAASLLGVSIGAMVGFTFSQQRALFTQLPISFFIPLDIVLAVFIGSLVAAVLSAAVPGRRVVRITITKLMRSV